MDPERNVILEKSRPFLNIVFMRNMGTQRDLHLKGTQWKSMLISIPLRRLMKTQIRGNHAKVS